MERVKIVNSQMLHDSVERQRYGVAKDCPHFAEDSKPTFCLWHRSFCLHPEEPDPQKKGYYSHCYLIWRGECPHGRGG